LTEDNLISYRLPNSQAVHLRASARTLDGSFIPETSPIDLDIAAVVKAARANGTGLIVQVPEGQVIEHNEDAIALDEDDVMFVSPAEPYGTCYFPNRYLADENGLHGRRGDLVDSLVQAIQPRVGEHESLIVGIGYPVAIAQALRQRGTNEINVESGNIGGVPLDGSGFGFNISPCERISQLVMFQRIWSGDIDHALLGIGEIDAQGCINIAKLNANYNGVGGFIDISQSLKKSPFVHRQSHV